jgi:hypothetical protein
MTQTSNRPVRAQREVRVPGPLDGPVANGSPPDALEQDLDDLRAALLAHPFPTQQDDLLAVLLGRREPVRLAWRLSRLSRTRTYHSIDEVFDDIRRGPVVT